MEASPSGAALNLRPNISKTRSWPSGLVSKSDRYSELSCLFNDTNVFFMSLWCSPLHCPVGRQRKGGTVNKVFESQPQPESFSSDEDAADGRKVSPHPSTS